VRKFGLFLLVFALVAAAAIAYLRATTPDRSTGLSIPLSGRHARLLASAPSSAEIIALIPTAAAFQRRLLANSVARDAATAWMSQQQLPHPWILGSADLVFWKNGRQTSFAIHVEPLRAALARIYLLFAGGESRFLINAGAAEPLGEAALAGLMEPAGGLESGDAIVIQKEGGRGSYPPIARPAVSIVTVTPKAILLTSVAPGGREMPPAVPPSQPKLPANALLAATFSNPPRALNDLDRLLGTKISTLISKGGLIALYDVNTGTLLPRPKGLIVVPATAENRAAARNLTKIAEVFGEVRETPEQIFIAFDKTSLGAWDSAPFVEPVWPDGDWSLRGNPARLAPLLEDLSGHTGLRLAAPRLYRANRDLRRWTAELERAEALEASHRQSSSREELRVRITSK
jgi:hypothetical protein